ncbi:MAG: glycosyltransferase family 4 protein [Verrucomicrobia bacterium]|nr:MAG: glycosyltransferase family 4 protein [Verrucomicrobiota bacterium]
MSKILVFHQVGGIGGATITLSNVVRCLVQAQFDVTVVCPAGAGQASLALAGARVLTAERPIWQFSHLSGFEKPALHPRFWMNFTRQLWSLRYWEEFIRAQKPDIVHFNAITLAPMAIAAQRAGVKVSLMIQETGVKGLFGLRTNYLRRLISRRADLVTFISKFDRDWYAIRGPNLQVVPNWVEEPQFGRIEPRATARNELGIPRDAKVVLFTGGVCPLKGTLELFEAVESLQGIEKLLVLVAGPKRSIFYRSLTRVQKTNRRCRQLLGIDYDAKIANVLRRPGVRHRIRFVGSGCEMAPLYCASDVVVFPATKPHQARPAIEAGYVKVPVIASDFSNLHEFLKDGENALLIRPSDSASLANGIRLVLNDTKLRDRLGEANHVYVGKNHNRETNTARLVAAFRSIISGKKQGYFNAKPAFISARACS